MFAALLTASRPKQFEFGSPINAPNLVPGTASSKSQVQQQVVEIKETTAVEDALPEWKRRMIEKNEAAKKEVTDIMDDSLRRVMAKTEMKPENQRGPAVDSYVSAVDWIMWSVNTVISRVK